MCTNALLGTTVLQPTKHIRSIIMKVEKGDRKTIWAVIWSCTKELSIQEHNEAKMYLEYNFVFSQK